MSKRLTELIRDAGFLSEVLERLRLCPACQEKIRKDKVKIAEEAEALIRGKNGTILTDEPVTAKPGPGGRGRF